MNTAQGTQAETAENSQKPGDFGTNGTRGVVLSGMSETTNSADTQSLPPIVEWRAYSHAEWAKQFALKVKGTPRPSTFAAEGGAERETTNSPAGIRWGCAGRKKAVVIALPHAVIIALFLVEALVIGEMARTLGGVVLHGIWYALGAGVLVALVLMFWDSGGEGV